MPTFDSLPAALQSWQNFYLLTGGAAATLTALMFVAVTFGASLVSETTSDSTRSFLDPIYSHFAQVLFTACMATIPTIGPTLFGVVFAGLSIFRLNNLRMVFGHYREAHRKNGDIELSDWLGAIIVPVICQLTLLASAVGFVLHLSIALSGLALVNLGILFTAVHGAWELLVWIALAVNKRSR